MPAGVVTLLQIRNAAKQESDNVGGSFISDAEWDGYIQRSYQELYGLVVQKFGNDYFTQTPAAGYTFTTDGINNLFALPEAFFKLLGVDLQTSTPGRWVPLKPFPFGERNPPFNAIPAAGQTVRLLYVPRLTVPTVDADTVDGVNGWEEYIIVDACLKAMGKEESDISAFMMRKQALIQRMESEVENRDAGSPATIVDSRGKRSLGMRYRLNANNLWLIGNAVPGFAPWGDWGEADYLY
jgi:hypothetical protein